jgi:hypothetical protein
MRSLLRQAFKLALGAAIVSTTLGAGAAHADVFDDTHSGWIYSNGWGPVSGGPYAGAYNGTLHVTQTAGSVATFTCLNTSAFDIYYSMAFNRGMFEVYINGVKYWTVDAYSPTTYRQVPLTGGYYFGYSGNVNITIKSLGTKNAASSGTHVDIDAIEC